MNIARETTPVMWCYGEITEAQTLVISLTDYEEYLRWCQKNANPWLGMSEAARSQNRRIRNRISARSSRIAKTLSHNYIIEQNTFLCKQNASLCKQNAFLCEQIKILHERLAALEPRQPQIICDPDFYFEMFGVVTDDNGRPLMYIGD